MKELEKKLQDFPIVITLGTLITVLLVFGGAMFSWGAKFTSIEKDIKNILPAVERVYSLENRMTAVETYLQLAK